MKKTNWDYVEPKRIEHLSESPCYKCGVKKKCDEKLDKFYNLWAIRDNVFGNKNYDFKQCPMWIALTCLDTVDES